MRERKLVDISTPSNIEQTGPSLQSSVASQSLRHKYPPSSMRKAMEEGVRVQSAPCPLLMTKRGQEITGEIESNHARQRH